MYRFHLIIITVNVESETRPFLKFKNYLALNTIATQSTSTLFFIVLSSESEVSFYSSMKQRE